MLKNVSLRMWYWSNSWKIFGEFCKAWRWHLVVNDPKQRLLNKQKNSSKAFGVNHIKNKITTKQVNDAVKEALWFYEDHFLPANKILCIFISQLSCNDDVRWVVWNLLLDLSLHRKSENSKIELHYTHCRWLAY